MVHVFLPLFLGVALVLLQGRCFGNLGPLESSWRLLHRKHIHIVTL